MDTRMLSLRFGALCDPIDKQLEEQGFYAPLRKIADCQKYADCVTLLSVSGIITESEARAARRRILKWLGKHITEAPNGTD